MRKWMPCLAGGLFAVSALADDGEGWKAHGLAWEANVLALLADARTNNNFKVMRQHDAIFSPVCFANSKDATEELSKYVKCYPSRRLALQLEALQFVYDMMDEDYDVGNPPLMFIDRDSNYNYITSDYFDTEEEWEAYKKKTQERRAENKRRIEKHARESDLKDYYRGLLKTVQATFKGIENGAIKLEDKNPSKEPSSGGEENHATGADAFKLLVDRHIPDPRLQRIIFSKHLVTPTNDEDTSAKTEAPHTNVKSQPHK